MFSDVRKKEIEVAFCDLFSYAQLFEIRKAYVLVYSFVFVFADDKFGYNNEVQAERIVIVIYYQCVA